MTRFALGALLAAALAAAATAAEPVLDLWPGAVPGEKGNVPEEKFLDPKPGEKPPLKRLTNISKPTLTVYKPAEGTGNGTAVIVAPGGGYSVLAWEHEGTQVGEWLQKLGVTAVVLKYRVPRRPDDPKDAPPICALQDAQRAVSVVRSKAKDWNVDPNKIGFLGFSAGGHLTAWTSTNHDKRAYETVDDADKQSCRPDFAILIYPGGLLDKADKSKLSSEIRVAKDTPPSFLVVSLDDKGSFDPTVAYLKALKDAGVKAELHVFGSGGHGYGMKPSDKPYATWPARAADWMRSEGFLPAAAKPTGTSKASPFPEGAKVEKLADGFKFTEGPSADAAGNVYFTDQPTDRILKWSTDGKLSTFLEKAGRSNGLCFDAAGNLWACADDKNELWKIDVASKAHTVAVKEFAGKKLNGPNDLWVRPDGGIYFTDPFYKRPYWERGPEEQDARALYFLAADGKVTRVDGDFKQPNGLVGTPDGKTLYVADIGANKTYAYDVKADGSLANRRKFCDLGSDGMTLDADGNVYLTGKGVIAFDRDGNKLGTLEVPEGWTANVCFGGSDMQTLFITAGKGLYAIKLNVKGAARQ